MAERRDIFEVIDRIRKVLPDEEHALAALLDSAAYTAPEAMRERWVDLTNIVNRHVFACPSCGEAVQILIGRR